MIGLIHGLMYTWCDMIIGSLNTPSYNRKELKEQEVVKLEILHALLVIAQIAIFVIPAD